jgi:methionyl-tRNA formyltransferase
VINTVFIGCVQSSLVALEALTEISDEVHLSSLITRRTSNYNSDFVDLSRLAGLVGCPILFIEDCPDDVSQASWVQALKPDIVFCVGWSRILDSKMLRIPPYGVIGYHPAALPANRGRHPLVWALALGLKKTASTFFMMDKGVDSGPIVSQATVDIQFSDDAQDLYIKMLELIPIQIKNICSDITHDRFNPCPQDHRLASYWRKRSSADGEIDWRMSSLNIYNLVRSLAKPYPGAHAIIDGKIIKIWKCRIVECSLDNIEPGRVIDVTEEGFLIKCGDGAIEIPLHDLPIAPKIGAYL